MKIILSSETVKLEGTFTTQDVFCQAMIDIIRSGGYITEKNKADYFSKNGFSVSSDRDNKGRNNRYVPSSVMIEIIKKGIEEGRNKTVEPFNLVSEIMKWMMNAVRAENKHQLAKHLNIEVTSPSAWEKAQYVPLKHIESAMEISVLMDRGSEAISRLTYTDIMIAKTIGVIPGAVFTMKKNQPKKYDLLVCGMKLKIARGMKDMNAHSSVDHQ